MTAPNAKPRARRGFAVPVRLLAAATAAALLAACGASGPAYRDPDPEIAAIVDIEDGHGFAPAEITIRVGDRVEWRNLGGEVHTVTADPRVAIDPNRVALPEGARPFHSAVIRPGRIFGHRFTVPGTYRYVCVPHEDRAEAGVVIVEPGS